MARLGRAVGEVLSKTTHGCRAWPQCRHRRVWPAGLSPFCARCRRGMLLLGPGMMTKGPDMTIAGQAW